jgi:hypothetical protein
VSLVGHGCFLQSHNIVYVYCFSLFVFLLLVLLFLAIVGCVFCYHYCFFVFFTVLLFFAIVGCVVASFSIVVVFCYCYCFLFFYCYDSYFFYICEHGYANLCFVFCFLCVPFHLLFFLLFIALIFLGGEAQWVEKLR